MLTTDSEICGTERIILSLLRHLDRTRFSASLVTLFGPGDLVAEVKKVGYSALNLRMKEGSKRNALMLWKQFLADHQPDVIQSLLIHSNILARVTSLFNRKVSILSGISTVYTVEGYGRLYGLIERYTHFLDTLYCVNSELGMKQVRDLIRLPERKLALVHNGLQLMDTPPDRSEMRKKLCSTFHFDSDDLVVGIVAQLRPAKRHDILIRSIGALATEFPNLRLLIIGQGEMESSGKTLVNELGIESVVRFAGYRNDARQLLYGMDVFALPSEVEGEPVSVMEAMDAELPIAAAATGGISEIVENHVSGMLAAPRDEKGFTDALRTILADKELRKSMGQAGKKRIYEKFSAERMTRQFEELYERCYAIKQGRGE